MIVYISAVNLQVSLASEICMLSIRNLNPSFVVKTCSCTLGSLLSVPSTYYSSNIFPTPPSPQPHLSLGPTVIRMLYHSFETLLLLSLFLFNVKIE